MKLIKLLMTQRPFCIAVLTIGIMIVGCGTPYKEINNYNEFDKKSYSITSPFYNCQKELLYDVNIFVGKRQFSGLLFMRLKANEDRFTLVSKTGQTLLDLELLPEKLNVVHAIPQLNRKMIFTQLERDLRLLVLNCSIEESVENGKIYVNDGTTRWPSCASLVEPYLFRRSGEGRLLELGSGKKRKMKRWIDFSNYVDDIPTLLSMNHRLLINLRLEMKQIKLK